MCEYGIYMFNTHYQTKYIALDQTKCLHQKPDTRGHWMVQLFKGLILYFGLDHDLGAVRLSPNLGSVLGVEFAEDSPLPLILSPHMHAWVLSLSFL